jgi:hypothetical protein
MDCEEAEQGPGAGAWASSLLAWSQLRLDFNDFAQQNDKRIAQNLS